MRTYLQVKLFDDTTDLELFCQGCGKTMRIADYYGKAVRPKVVSTINLLRLMEFVGQFTVAHSECEVKSNDESASAGVGVPQESGKGTSSGGSKRG